MFQTKQSTVLIASMLVVLLAQVQDAPAQEQRWTNPAGGDFSNASNWDTDVPDDTEDARFDVDAIFGVSLTADHSVAGFFQEQGVITLSGGFALNVLQPSNIYDGTLNLTGAGTQFIQSGEFAIGRDGGNANFNVLAGASLSTVVGRLGYTGDSTGSANIDGGGSQWLLSSNLIVGREGTGSLTIQNGGLVSAGNSLTIGSSGATGNVLVTGTGSSFFSASNTSQVGSNGLGTLRIENSGQATFSGMIVGNGASGNGSVLVDGGGSSWIVTGVTTVGGSGTGDVEIRNGASATTGSILTMGTSTGGTGTININSGGSLTSHLSRIGHVSGANAAVNVSGASSRWDITNQLFLGNSGDGTVSISDGGLVTVSSSAQVGSAVGSTGQLNVTGVGSELISSNLDVGYRGQGAISINDGGLVSTEFANIGRLSGSNGTAVVNGVGSRWNNTGTFDIGASGTGSLTVSGGVVVSTIEANVAQSLGSNGSLLVSGVGSQFLTESIVVGGPGPGLAIVEMGGHFHSTGYFGLGSGGTTIVRDAGSQWINDDQVNVTGLLSVESGGMFTSGVTYLGSANFDGTAVVNGSGSSWTSDASFSIGRFSTGNLSIENGGLVTNQLTTLGRDGGTGMLTVQGNGSRLETTSLSVGLFGNGSAMIQDGGQVETTTTQVFSDETGSTSSELIVTGVGSQLTGSASLFLGLGDSRLGTMTVEDGAVVSLGGSMNVAEAGTLNLDHANVVVGATFQNDGQVLITGDSTITGGLTLTETGRLETSNNSTIFINGDVIHNGMEVSTELGSRVQFADDVSGAGSYTGLGNIEFGGEFSPGNSPAAIDFEGDVTFLSDSLLSIELGGTNVGAFDQLLIDGDLSLLNGNLDVTLIDGFELSEGMEFLFADVGGVLSGQFQGLGEAALVGNFGDTSLYISYAYGDGNDVGLFTSSSVPEPSGMTILFAATVFGFGTRRRRRAY